VEFPVLANINTDGSWKQGAEEIRGPKTDQVTGIWRSYFLNFYGIKISDCRKIQNRMISRDYECIQYLNPQNVKETATLVTDV
jgi:hypothetical protein